MESAEPERGTRVDISRAVVIKSELLSDSSDKIEEIECHRQEQPFRNDVLYKRGISVLCRQVSGRVMIGGFMHMASVK